MTEKEINHRIAALLRYPVIPNDQTDLAEVVVGVRDGKRVEFDFCNSWTDGGPLVEQFGITLKWDGEQWWGFWPYAAPGNVFTSMSCSAAGCHDEKICAAPKPLVAAMLAVIALHERSGS